MSERDDGWQASVTHFVLDHLPGPGARVLEIGCGSTGELALALGDAGYEVIAVDPQAPAGPNFRRETFESFSDAGEFDAIVASLSLHHVADPPLVLDKAAGLLASTGSLIVIEWAWERFDDATAQWCFARLPPVSGHDPGWLQRTRDDWERSRVERESFRSYFRRWAASEGLHPSQQTLVDVRARFTERLFAWGPYFYRDLGDTSQADEQAAIDAGTIQATGWRFVGHRRDLSGRSR